MEKLNTIRTALQGKKTYFAVAIGCLYLIGVWAGFWEWNETVLAFFGLSGLAFLRSAMARNLFVPMIAVLCVGLLTGCKTPQGAGRALSSTVTTVDAAMQGWATWVALGQATAADEARVKSAYEVYQAAEKIAEDAYIAWSTTGNSAAWERASVVLRSSQTGLLELLEQLQKPQRHGDTETTGF